MIGAEVRDRERRPGSTKGDWMRRKLYTDDHEAYRDTVRRFFAREVVPQLDRWESQGLIDRSVFALAAAQGIYGLSVPEAYGGSGETDYRYRLIVNEETARIGATSLNLSLGLQDDLVLAYLLHLANEEQQRRWLPAFARGELLGALAMTEPGAGSDLRGIRTRAYRDGSDWILDGQKIFISGAIHADLVIVAARTESESGSDGLSLLVVERDMPGMVRRKLNKVGLHAQDTGELFFDQVRVPERNLLGTPGLGMRYMMGNLPQERLALIVLAYTDARAVFDVTVRYCFDREAFGRVIGEFQNTRFVLAEMETELDVAQSFVDNCVMAHNAGELTDIDAAKGKWYVTELQKRVIDRCVQLHGGYGYMTEYRVARAYLDGRAQTIYGGTTEIMKEIIGRDIARVAT